MIQYSSTEELNNYHLETYIMGCGHPNKIYTSKNEQEFLKRWSNDPLSLCFLCEEQKNQLYRSIIEKRGAGK